MIYDVVGDKVILEGCEFTIGERIMATSGNYAGLKGCITEIRTGPDKETENDSNDIHCCFDYPADKEKIRLLEKYFSDLYGKKKTIDDIALDLVILAPNMLRRLNPHE